jgi:hypothetical protein
VYHEGVQFDAAFRKTTVASTIPLYFIVDEAQEIGAGMRQVQGMEPVVQPLLANSSTQAFFSQIRKI